MIAIVGDSFCADYDTSLINNNTRRDHQTYTTSESWVTEVVKHFDNAVDVHGYGGKSWWYSWQSFWNCWKDRIGELSAIVFCHTDPNRINTCNTLMDPIPGGTYLTTTHERNRANDIFYKFLYDESFQLFAQEQYAKLLYEKFYKIKTLHFFSVVPNQYVISSLPGSVFLTPLTKIAVAGITGSKHTIASKINDQQNKLYNHLTPLNNLAMGAFVINALENYQSGIHSINMSKFVVQNTNYIYWPNGAWGEQ